MATKKPIVCGKNRINPPEKGCTDCEELERRVEALEECCAEVEGILPSKLEAEDILGSDYINVTVNEDGDVVISTTKEQLIAALGYEEIELTKIDEDGKMITAHVLGYISEEQGFVWSGMDQLEVEVDEEFDPMDGVGATGCNMEPVESIELLTPIIEGVTNWIVPLNGNIDLMYGISGIAVNGGDCTDLITVDDSALDLSTDGDYEVRYSVVDNDGNYAEESAIITVLAGSNIPFEYNASGTAPTDIESTIYILDSNDEIVIINGIGNMEYPFNFNNQTIHEEIELTDAVSAMPIKVGFYNCDNELFTDTSDAVSDVSVNCHALNVSINVTTISYSEVEE